MTRAEAREFLVSLGLTEPSEEQVSNYLNTVNKETQKEKDKADKLKADADKVKELQKQLDELNKANMSEIERANTDKADAENKVAELEKQIAEMKLKASFSDIGIVGEDYDNLFKDGNLDVSALGKIISNRIETAKSDAIRDIADKADATVQGGTGASNKDDEVPADVQNAMKLEFGVQSPEQDVADAYLLK